MAIRRPLVLLDAGIVAELPSSDQLPNDSLTNNLKALGNLLGSANKSFYFTAAGAMALYDLTIFGRSLASAANQVAGRTALGLGTAATRNIGTSGANVPLLSTGNTWSASQTINSSLQVSGGIEVGRTDGIADTGNIDLHSGTTPTDYDARIQCTGGDGTSGRGTLSVLAGNIDLNAGIGSTVLRHGGVQKLTTSATGITVSGQVESSLPTYNNLTLLAPFTWDAAGDAADYHQPSYTKVDNVVRLRGKVTVSGTHVDMSTWALRNIAVLPVGFRPAKRKAFTIFWDSDTPLFFSYCLVFVNTDGGIFMLIANGQPYPFTEGHFPLDQIWFDLAN